MYSTFFKHRTTPHLYQLQDGKHTQDSILTNSRSMPRTYYINVPYHCNLRYTREDFTPVDVHYIKKGISVVGAFAPKPVSQIQTTSPISLLEAFHSLPSSLQHICGTIKMPSDNGVKLLNAISSSGNSIYGASDASVKDGWATHAWIISSRDINDINDGDMHIAGTGPVDGLLPYISFSRAKLTGITAISVITRLFLEYHLHSASIQTFCNNQGVIKKCQSISFGKLCRHWDPNSDLCLKSVIRQKHPTQYNWVRGKQGTLGLDQQPKGTGLVPGWNLQHLVW